MAKSKKKKLSNEYRFSTMKRKRAAEKRRELWKIIKLGEVGEKNSKQAFETGCWDDETWETMGRITERNSIIHWSMAIFNFPCRSFLSITTLIRLVCAFSQSEHASSAKDFNNIYSNFVLIALQALPLEGTGPYIVGEFVCAALLQSDYTPRWMDDKK